MQSGCLHPSRGILRHQILKCRGISKSLDAVLLELKEAVDTVVVGLCHDDNVEHHKSKEEGEEEGFVGCVANLI